MQQALSVLFNTFIFGQVCLPLVGQSYPASTDVVTSVTYYMEI
jgi:hypothetical protein